jgi:hypothetical protein
LLNADEVLCFLDGMIDAARNTLLQMPGRLAPLLAGETDETKIRETIEDDVNRVLTTMAERCTELGKSPQHPEGQ